MGEGRRVVVGIGNPDRGDDAAGRLVARRLAAMIGALSSDTLPPTPHPVPPSQGGRDRVGGFFGNAVEIYECDGEATEILGCIEGADQAYLVDACVSGAEGGTVHEFDAAAGPLAAARFGISTHGFGLAEAIELARALGRLPAVCMVYAIEGERFETGTGVSPAVARAVDEVAESLSGALGGVTARTTGPSPASPPACP